MEEGRKEVKKERDREKERKKKEEARRKESELKKEAEIRERKEKERMATPRFEKIPACLFWSSPPFSASSLSLCGRVPRSSWRILPL